MSLTVRAASVCVVIATIVGCSGTTKTSTPTTPTAPPPTPVVLNAPVLVAPADGTVATSWPTFTVNNSTRSGPAGNLVYRFDIATGSDFATITITSSVPEGAGQTSYTPTAAFPADQTTLYWRVTAIDSANSVQSPASSSQSVRFSNPPTQAAKVAAQQGRTLWSGTVPPGDPGHAKMGNGWQVGNLVSFDGVAFLSPELDELQIFDCMDRGMGPQQAIDWLHSHGYSTQAVWYPDTGSGIGVIGFPHQYIAFVGGQWDMTTRAGA
jgi:hypothetical protein